MNQNREGVAALREAVRLNPKFADAHFQLGNAYDKLGQNEEAAKAFAEAVSLNPQDADAYFNLGNAYSKLNRYREAADAYGKVIALKPTTPTRATASHCFTSRTATATPPPNNTTRSRPSSPSPPPTLSRYYRAQPPRLNKTAGVHRSFASNRARVSPSLARVTRRSTVRY